MPGSDTGHMGRHGGDSRATGEWGRSLAEEEVRQKLKSQVKITKEEKTEKYKKRIKRRNSQEGKIYKSKKEKCNFCLSLVKGRSGLESPCSQLPRYTHTLMSNDSLDALEERAWCAGRIHHVPLSLCPSVTADSRAHLPLELEVASAVWVSLGNKLALGYLLWIKQADDPSFSAQQKPGFLADIRLPFGWNSHLWLRAAYTQ